MMIARLQNCELAYFANARLGDYIEF